MAVGVTMGYSFVATYVILKAVNAFVTVRASEKNEILGLDLTQHHENAYTVLE
jgi:Amt family ammonium transporter